MTPGEKSKLLDLMALWRNEGLDPLSYVVGYSQLLLEEGPEELNEEQRRIMEMVFKAGMRAADCWNIATTYLRLQYGTDVSEYIPVKLQEVVNEAESHLNKLKTFRHISTKIPSDLPLIEERWPLHLAFSYILDSPSLRHCFNNKTATITAFLQNEDEIQVQIQIEGVIKAEAQLNPESLFHPGTALSVAQLIIMRHGGELQIQNVKDTIMIEFALPIWSQKVA